MEDAAETLKKGLEIDRDDRMLKELSARLEELRNVKLTSSKRKEPEGSTFAEAINQIHAAGLSTTNLRDFNVV